MFAAISVFSMKPNRFTSTVDAQKQHTQKTFIRWTSLSFVRQTDYGFAVHKSFDFWGKCRATSFGKTITLTVYARHFANNKVECHPAHANAAIDKISVPRSEMWCPISLAFRCKFCKRTDCLPNSGQSGYISNSVSSECNIYPTGSQHTGRR